MSAPDIKVSWVRGRGGIDFSKPNVFFCLGMRGAGKSSFLEMCAAKYLDAGGKVFDLFSARDGESLAWLRSPYAKEKEIVLLRGDFVEIKSGHASIPASKFSLSDLDHGDIFISTGPLYSDMDEEFAGVNHIINVLWNRHYWSQPIFVVIREAANLIYSRMKVRHEQSLAKAETLYMMRESRHCGLALGLDSIKHTSIDADVRVLTDYLILKNTGVQSLPDDLHWVYSIFDPYALRNLKPHEFIVLNREGDVGLGVFDMPPWHKQERENILKEVGLELKYYAPVKEKNYVKELIAKAIEALPQQQLFVEDIVNWIRENRQEIIHHVAVGRYLHEMGYATQRKVIDGKQKTLLVKVA